MKFGKDFYVIPLSSVLDGSHNVIRTRDVKPFGNGVWEFPARALQEQAKLAGIVSQPATLGQILDIVA